MWIAPQRVDEDADRAPGRAHVFDLAAREPIVDGPAADADELARLHDGNRFAFHSLPPGMVSEATLSKIRLRICQDFDRAISRNGLLSPSIAARPIASTDSSVDAPICGSGRTFGSCRSS